jgi:phosphoesterase RecJ-like protein
LKEHLNQSHRLFKINCEIFFIFANLKNSMLTQQQIESFASQLVGNKKIAVVTHYNPDGDALGSSLAIVSHFSRMGFESQCIVPNPFPDYLSWMPGVDRIINAQKHLKKARSIIEKADILFIADMNAAHRAGKDLEEVLENTKAFKVLIDHHPNPSYDADIIYSTIQSTSACELVYRFLTEVFPSQPLSLDVANCVYTGMITDTGSLSYACNRPLIYQILKELMEIGVDGELIHRQVYDNYSESRLRLLGAALNNMVVMNDNATTYMFLTKKDLHDNGFKNGDTEGFVNYGLALSTVKFTAFFTEREGRIRISFRSKDTFDVNIFASTYFNGGGHKNASASYHYDTLDNTLRYFEDIVKNHPDLQQ